MKKTMRKLIPAVIMLLIAAMLVGTSTYAWFSMNSKVTVTGMTVNAKVSDNILIAASNTSDTNYSGGLNQIREARLAPVSTTTATTFYYANSQTQVLGNGESKASGDSTKTFSTYNESTSQTHAAAGKENYDADFQAQAGITGAISTSNVAYGYIDYVFFLKATNADSANAANLNMTVCNLLYNGSPLVSTSGKEDRAWRIAVFVEDSAKETETATLGTLKTILAPSGATYYVAGKAATSTTALGTVTTGTAATLKSISAGATVYERVTVRLWLEGEDNRCTNETYTALDGKWSLDLAFAIQPTATPGIGAIQSTAITTAVDGATGSITLTSGKLSNDETPATYAWKNAADDTAATGTNNAASYTATATGTYYCLITTTDGNVYRTANLDLTVGG